MDLELERINRPPMGLRRASATGRRLASLLVAMGVGLPVVASGVSAGSSTVASAAFQEDDAQIVDLGLPANAVSVTPRDVNDLGQVVGYYTTSDDDGTHIRAFVWHDGRFTRLPSLTEPGWQSNAAAYAIRPSGVVVGWTGEYWAQAVRWDKGKVARVGRAARKPSKNSVAVDISDNGKILLKYPSEVRAEVRQHGRVTPIVGPRGTRYLQLYDINDRGEVCGAWGGNSFVPAVWKQGRRVNLPDLPGHVGSTFALGINASGAVAGVFSVVGDSRAVLWEDGRARELLPAAGLPYAGANAINKHGDVVGKSFENFYGGGNSDHATLWRDKSPSLLDGLLPENSGWKLSTAVAISDGGLVVGEGVHRGESRAYLLRLD
jgi:probable HAF family extracellular repeat protein